jgi:hypothetical protein
MDINFDLDVNNYNIKDLIHFFNLPTNYNIELLNTKVSDMENKLIAIEFDSKYKFDIINFIKLAKDILLSTYYDIQNDNQIKNREKEKEPTILTKNYLGKIINPLAVHPALQNTHIYSNDITGYNHNDTTSVYIFNTVTRENYFGSSSTNCTFHLPFKLKNILSISLTSLQLPNVFFAFSAERGTNQIYICEDETELSGIVTIPDGNYTNIQNTTPGIPTTSIGNAMEKAINEQILGITDPNLYRFFVSVDPVTNFTRIYNNSFTFSMKLMTNNLLFMEENNFNTANVFPNSNIDNKQSINNYSPPYSFPDYDTDNKIKPSEYTSTLGYLLGYRNILYKGSSTYISESTFNGVYSSYLYFALNDYTGSQQISTTYGVLQNSLIDDNVLAVIPLNGSTYSYIFENNSNLIYKRRDYFGPVDISKISIKLLSPFGDVVNLLKNDFSFSITITSNYNLKKSDIPFVTPVV